MNVDLLVTNLTNPAFLFFLLGLVAVFLKSDLEIPPTSSKFIALYLLFAIGFKGGQELAHSAFTTQIALVMATGVASSFVIPIMSFYILRRRMSTSDAGALAAAYGSVSAVTFVTAVSYLEMLSLPFHGHLVATMALMESPAIVAGLLLISWYSTEDEELDVSKRKVIKHSFTNGSVLVILGSLAIGLVADADQAEGLTPFTNELFKGFLAIFLLDMGITSGKKLSSLRKYGAFPILFALVMPLVNGVLMGLFSNVVTADVSDRFMLSVLAASASYIAVPAAMKMAAPLANEGLYIPMPLAITFPLNITVGFPIYMWVVS